MAKERNRHGEKQQIDILADKIWDALEIYLAEITDEPFEYRHYGLLFSETKAHFQRIGFALEWHRDPSIDLKSYWTFTMPRNTARYLTDFR